MGMGVRSIAYMLNGASSQQASSGAADLHGTTTTTLTSLNTITPCAACKLLRRRCAEGCPFFPYFFPHEPHKFAAVHKVFGASNVSKMLMEVLAIQRADAANNLAHEANLRVRDPVCGCIGAVSALQQQIQYLAAELNEVRAEISKYKRRGASTVSHNSKFGCGCGTKDKPAVTLISSPFLLLSSSASTCSCSFSSPPPPDSVPPPLPASSAISSNSSSSSSSLYTNPTSKTAYSSISGDHPYIL